MKSILKKIGSRMPRSVKEFLLQTSITRNIVWKLYGYSLTPQITHDNQSDKVATLLMNRAVDDLLIEVRLLALRIAVLEERIEESG